MTDKNVRPTRMESQDATLAEKENKTPMGSDYAGGGWCSKNVFLTALDKDKTMIRYVMVK